MAWKLSVVEMAPDFSRGAQFTTKFNGAYGSGGVYPPINSEVAKLHWLKGDILKLGPSNHVNNPGACEQVKIIAVNDMNLMISSPLSYSYASGDDIFGVGSGIPEGWQVGMASYSEKVHMFGLAGKEGALGTPVKGFNSPTSWQQKRDSGIGSVCIFYYVPHRRFLSNITYRLGFYYKQTGKQGNSPFIQLSDGGSIAYYYLDSNYSTWTYVSVNGSLVSGNTNPPYIRYVFPANGYCTLIGVDCIHATHASLISGATNGVYSIPVNPVSVQEIEKGYGKQYVARYGQNIDFGSLQSQTARSIRLVFDDADTTFLKNLEVFSYWQNLGYMLMLEPEAVDNTRPIFGYIDFNYLFPHWDENRLTIDLVFKGIR